MPYVPSEKTDPPADDRRVLAPFIRNTAKFLAAEITTNGSLITVYDRAFFKIADTIRRAHEGRGAKQYADLAQCLGKKIFEVGARYGYEGAFLGELNYAVTRLIQIVPQKKVDRGEWKESDELRYWLYASTVEALMLAEKNTLSWKLGIGGVFADVKDEYKRRVNTAYEAAQIIKSGDCYDTPYYTRLIRVVDVNGTLVGHQEVMLKRSTETLNVDVLDWEIVVRNTKKE